MPKCQCNTSNNDVAVGNGVSTFSLGWKWGFLSRRAKSIAKDQAMNQYNTDLNRAKIAVCNGIPCDNPKSFCKVTVGGTPIAFTYTPTLVTLFGKTFKWGGTWGAGISNAVTGDCWV